MKNSYFKSSRYDKNFNLRARISLLSPKIKNQSQKNFKIFVKKNSYLKNPFHLAIQRVISTPSPPPLMSSRFDHRLSSLSTITRIHVNGTTTVSFVVRRVTTS